MQSVQISNTAAFIVSIFHVGERLVQPNATRRSDLPVQCANLSCSRGIDDPGQSQSEVARYDAAFLLTAASLWLCAWANIS